MIGTRIVGVRTSTRVALDGERPLFVVAKAKHPYGTEGQDKAMADVIWLTAVRRERVRQGQRVLGVAASQPRAQRFKRPTRRQRTGAPMRYLELKACFECRGSEGSASKKRWKNLQ